MAEKKSGAFRTTIGGQALIEGILMRGPGKAAIVGPGAGGTGYPGGGAEADPGSVPDFGPAPDRGSVTFLDSMVKA